MDLKVYEANRIPHYAKVRQLFWDVEQADTAEDYAREYAKFSHWMLNIGYQFSRSQTVNLFAILLKTFLV